MSGGEAGPQTLGGSADIPVCGFGRLSVASPVEHGTGNSLEPADRNVCATIASTRTPKPTSEFGLNAASKPGHYRRHADRKMAGKT